MPLQGIVEARFILADNGGVYAALSVHVIHVAVIATFAYAGAAMPRVPYVVHGLRLLCVGYGADKQQNPTPEHTAHEGLNNMKMLID